MIGAPRVLPPELRKAFRIEDALLRAGPIDFRGGDAVHLYLERERIRLDPARLSPGVVLSHPRLANWALHNVTTPAMIVLGQPGPCSDGAAAEANPGRVMECTFLTRDGLELPKNGRLISGAVDGQVALIAAAPEGGSPEAAWLTHSPLEALRIVAAGFAGAVYCAFKVRNMARVALPAEVRHLHLAFAADAAPGERAAVVATWEGRGLDVSDWTIGKGGAS